MAIVDKKNKEITSLGGEINEAQENIRLSAQQLSKMGGEINDYKLKLTVSSQESENYKQRIQKLLSENSAISEEYRNAQ